MTTDKPIGCINPKPNAISIEFGGEYINLSAIARTTGITLSYVSRIFSGIRYPGVHVGRKIASALGMTVDAFFHALDARLKANEQKADFRVKGYLERIRKEEEEDQQMLKAGRIPLPRNPGLYHPRDVR